MVFSPIKSIVLAAVASNAMVNAHQKMIVPDVKWLEQYKYNGNSPCGTIDSTGFEGSVAAGSDANCAFYESWLKKEGYTSLGDMLSKVPMKLEPGASQECGLSEYGSPQPLPDQVKWDAFSHPGPCEVWCDDKLAYHHDRCEIKHANGVLPYDKSKCVGAKHLRSLWIGLHTPVWQVYIGCATIGGSGGGSGSTPAITPAANNPAPAYPQPQPQPSPAPAPAPNSGLAQLPTGSCKRSRRSRQ